MLPMLLDARPLVRSISCWALSRYSYWIVQASIELNSQGKQQFDTVVAVRCPLLTIWPVWRACGAVNHAHSQRIMALRADPKPAHLLSWLSCRPPVALLCCLACQEEGHWLYASAEVHKDRRSACGCYGV